MSGPIKVVIIDQDAGTRRLMRDVYGKMTNLMTIIADTDSLMYGYELIRTNRPNLVFVDLRPNEIHKSLETIQRVSTYFKDTMIVVSGTDVTLETIMACMQAGAREFLRRPISDMDLVNLVEKHRNSLLNDASGDKTGRMLTVFSNKGGLGKTAIAVNLALALSEVVQKPVAVVDLNLQLGDITTFLDIVPKQTIVDIAKNIGRVDRAYLESSLAEFKSDKSHIYILADPHQVEEAEEVTAEQINTVLTVLKATFEYVIVDTTTSFDSRTLTALDLADTILLVSMVNLPNIRSTQRVLNLFDRLGYDKQRIKLVINRFVPDEEITIADVEDALEHEVYWKIPNNYFGIMTAINRGIPINSFESGRKLYQNFVDLSRQITGTVLRHKVEEQPQTEAGNPTITAPSKSLLGGLFNKK